MYLYCMYLYCMYVYILYVCIYTRVVHGSLFLDPTQPAIAVEKSDPT